jgi:hypothetical protein
VNESQTLIKAVGVVMVAGSGRSLKRTKGQSRISRQVLLLSLLVLPVIPTAAIAEVIDSTASTAIAC